jgi:cation diffusion facilitator CzcD-associated flavoprotein CzcO
VTEPRVEVDAVVVGAGFAGLYAHHRLREIGLTVQGYEAAADVGGTWWWNRYPGARCDLESWDYCYAFPEVQQEWTWTERYATQPEILRYIEHVADRLDLRRDIQFDTRVTAAKWDEAAQRWHVETDRGDRVAARFLVMATGNLSAAKDPEIPGIETFSGAVLHTGRWPHEGVDFSGQRVGVIGTGSSGIQSIPLIAQQAAHLTVFQRTPNFTMPAKNALLDADAIAARKARADEIRETMRHKTRAGVIVPMPETSALSVDADAREERFWAAWESGTLYGMTAAYTDLLVDQEANETAAEFIRARIRETVDDPEVAQRLSPRGHPFGAKRPCLDTDYYATFNRDDVDLVDVRAEPIVEVTPTGIRTEGGEYKLDAIVFATGFDAMTGPLLGPAIIGVDDVALRDKWAAGPRTYLGLMTAGFPNLFTVTGPGSPSVLVNMVVAIEQHVDWIAGCIEYLRRHQLGAIDATVEAEDRWVGHVSKIAGMTLFPEANSWYMGANVPGKPRVFMPYIGGLPAYTKVCNEVAADDYRGFALTPVGRGTSTSARAPERA